MINFYGTTNGKALLPEQFEAMDKELKVIEHRRFLIWLFDFTNFKTFRRNNNVH